MVGTRSVTAAAARRGAATSGGRADAAATRPPPRDGRTNAPTAGAAAGTNAGAAGNIGGVMVTMMEGRPMEGGGGGRGGYSRKTVGRVPAAPTPTGRARGEKRRGEGLRRLAGRRGRATRGGRRGADAGAARIHEHGRRTRRRRQQRRRSAVAPARSGGGVPAAPACLPATASMPCARVPTTPPHRPMRVTARGGSALLRGRRRQVQSRRRRAAGRRRRHARSGPTTTAEISRST